MSFADFARAKEGPRCILVSMWRKAPITTGLVPVTIKSGLLVTISLAKSA